MAPARQSRGNVGEGISLRSENLQADSLSGTRYEEWPLSDARRAKHWPAHIETAEPKGAMEARGCSVARDVREILPKIGAAGAT